MLHPQLAWYIAGPVMGLCVIAIRLLFNARLGVTGGFSDVSVETVELDCVWETADDAIATISGTPFGPLVAGLPVADQDAVRASLAERLGCNVPGQVTIRTTANIARGVA